MSDKKLISVIVPVYNTERYLKKCLESLLCQSYSNLEIICVDDGSTDGSLAILRHYESCDHRIKVITQKNKGISSARNTGLTVSNGAFFGFIDSDDYLEADMYELLLKKMIHTKADIAACSYYINKNGSDYKTINHKPVPKNILSASKSMKYVYQRDTYKAVGGYIWTRLFRTSRYKKNGRWRILFNESLTYGEDVLFLAHCLLQARTTIYINKYLYHYTQRESSASHNYYMRIDKMGSLDAYQNIIRLYEQNHVSKIIILLVKRFYVYHASLLLEYAYNINYHKNDVIIRRAVKRYLREYIITNISKPGRILHILKLLLIR